jgi:hypothetical protein
VIAVAGIFTLLYFSASNAREQAKATICVSNIKQLSLGTLMYSQDYDEVFPLPNSWTDAIIPYTKNEELHHCPSVSDQSLYGYAFNENVVGESLGTISSPQDIVMIFESSSGQKNAQDSMPSLPSPPRHRNRSEAKNSIGFVDGHVKMYSESDASALTVTIPK